MPLHPSLVPRPRPAPRFSVLQATKSWAGPGNEASYIPYTIGEPPVPTMLRALSIPTLAACKKQLKLCTFFSYMNGLSIAPIANLIHRDQSRHMHDLSFVFPIARTNQYMYSFSPYNLFVEQLMCSTF